MANIHVLDKAVAELIAAGEVVERPASIVKELLENAIDAGSTAITVEIKGGGVSYLRISDNGCGISREDIPRAFLRHATSKVRSADDLDGIRTLGFRGEALASIAAMCRVELTTKAADEDEGTTYKIQGGEHLESYPAGCPTGTTMVVRDVFFNTPARMKFLKRDISEGNSVAQVVDKCALSHPEVAFRFIRDNQTKLRTSGSGDLLSAIYAIYGKEFADSMIPVRYAYEDSVQVSGYVSAPSGAKPSRTYQNFFINGRYVRTRTASAAVEEAFKNKLMGKKFPACVLNLEIDAETVDVNVHPAKIEVRFVNEKPIFNAVYFGVKSALAALDDPLAPPVFQPEPTVEAAPLRPTQPEPQQQRMTSQEFRLLFDGGQKPEPVGERPISFRSSSSSLDISVDDDVSPTFSPIKPLEEPFSERILPIRPDTIVSQTEIFATTPTLPPETENTAAEQPDVAETPPQQPLKLIGELFGTYILLEQGEDMVLVDKHAAHERVIYEELRRNLDYGNRQVLLEAAAVTLAREDYDAILANLDKLEAMGFGVEDFGGSTVLVRETPIQLGGKDVGFVIGEIADNIRQSRRDLTPEVLDRLYYSIACRSAIKAHDKNHPLELAEIIEKLRQNPQITHCPHGRPVSVRMSRHQVEKMFGRIV